MARLNKNKLKIDTLDIKSVNSGGGGWPLNQFHPENWAWAKDAFSSTELDAIINIGSECSKQRAQISSGYNGKIRNSDVSFMFPNEINNWIFARMADYINGINEGYFKFDLFGMIQGIQYTEYRAPGQHYDWHMDMGKATGVRKLSVSVQLSDPDDYEGGDLQLWYGGDYATVPRDRGFMTFFPSYIMHRVTPVTKGTRRSLVCWVTGPSFK